MKKRFSLGSLAMAFLLSVPGSGAAKDDPFLAMKSFWDERYRPLLEGQAAVAKEWKASREKARVVGLVHSETEKLNRLFEAYGASPAEETEQALVSGIGRFCSAVRQLQEAQSPFSDVVYVVNMSDTEWMGKYFGDRREVPAVADACKDW